ncbi:Mobile element protein [Acetobacter pomorum]|nr:Mobile element protein [Acetobacter pomorum]
MSDQFWLTDEQMERLRPFFPKSQGKPDVVWRHRWRLHRLPSI